MKVEITLHDKNKEPVLVLTNSGEDDFLCLKISEEHLFVYVPIEELKLALIKFTIDRMDK